MAKRVTGSNPADTHNTTVLGYYASTLTTIVTFGIAIFIPPLSGSSQRLFEGQDAGRSSLSSR
jgi:hypothetical protein